MHADAVMRKRDVRDLGRRLRHVALNAIVVGPCDTMLQRVAARIVAVACEAGRSMPRSIFRTFVMSAMTRRACQRRRLLPALIEVHLLDVADDRHLGRVGRPAEVDLKRRERQTGSKVGGTVGCFARFATAFTGPASFAGRISIALPASVSIAASTQPTAKRR